MYKREIPHEHWCSVCKRPSGCEDAFCVRELWDVCERPACLEVYRAATVHLFASDQGILPCCGKSRFDTPGDRMTTDRARVTCAGREAPDVMVPTSVRGLDIGQRWHLEDGTEVEVVAVGASRDL